MGRFPETKVDPIFPQAAIVGPKQTITTLTISYAESKTAPALD